MSQSLPIRRFSYQQPECELTVQGVVSPLSQWLEQTVLRELDFCLRVGNTRLQGDRQLLEELMIGVANYLEVYLQWDRVEDLVHLHQVSYGRWRKLELTTLELFDLHVVLEELSGQCQLLPKISLTASNRPIWLSMAAILIAVAGLGTWRITNFEPVPQVSNAKSPAQTPVAVRPEAGITSRDSPRPSVEPTPELKKQPQAPQPITFGNHERSADVKPKPAPPVDDRINRPSPTPASTPQPTVTASAVPSSEAPLAVIPEEPPAESSSRLLNQPQGRSPKVPAKMRIVSLRKLSAPDPSDSVVDYGLAIAQLNDQLNQVLPMGASTEAIPKAVVLILTAVKAEDKRIFRLRAEANQSQAVKQIISLLEEALNRDRNVQLPAGEYELLLQIAE